MGCVADGSPASDREDRLGPWGTRAVTLVPVPAAGPDCGEATASSALAAASRSDANGCFGMRFANRRWKGPRTTHHHWLIRGGIVMHLGSTIIERVETFVRHPVFAGSDKAMDFVLNDLEAMVEAAGRPATYRRLRDDPEIAALRQRQLMASASPRH